MANVYTYTLTTGVIEPDAAVIQTEVQNEYINAFGSDLDVTSPSTPQGLLINAETQARIAVAANNAAIANQINPAFAGGVFLDALLGLMGAQRIAASNSTVNCTITGLSGTIIPVGSLVEDTNGNQWQTLQVITIPLSGSIANGVFTAVEVGAITVNANQVTNIVSNILGWDAINNPAQNYFTGQATQSDAQAKQYRINTLYLQSNGLAGSVIAALSALTGVQSLSFLENTIASTQVIEGVTMTANSIYVCIQGGSDAAIAACLTATKSAGCGYSNGGSQVSITQNGTLASGSEIITALSDVTGLVVGMSVTGTGVPLYAVITGILSSTSISISLNATVSSVESLTFNNSITYPYVVPLSNQTINVLFDRPDIIQIGVELTVILNTPIQDYITTLTDAILNYAVGDVDGLAGLIVGGNVSPFEIAAAIGIQYPGAYVTNLLISKLTPVVMNGTTTMSSQTITGLTNVLTVLDVGMSVSGSGIMLGSVITALLDDTSITISLNATAGATVPLTFTGNYAPQELKMAPWQFPQIQASNVTVSLAS